MVEISQRTLGYVRDALSGSQPENVYTPHDVAQFWKRALFDAGFPQQFIEVAATYRFNWTDIIPDLYTGKFGPKNRSTSAYQVPAEMGERFLFKLIKIALLASANSKAGEQLKKSLERDGAPSIDFQQDQRNAKLSGLPNKDALLEDLTAKVADGRLNSVLFVDLDNFKSVNDELGHSEGDACLVQMVGTMTDATSGKGKLYRVGGDEFCVLLPNFSSAEAAATAERIRDAIARTEPFGGRVKVTASIGVAGSDVCGAAKPESLIDAADQAMYVSKRATKNQVTIWQPSKSD